METSTVEVGRKHGIDPMNIDTLADRLDFQWKVLRHHEELLQTRPRPMILDRTPLDSAAYMLAEVGMRSHRELTPEQLTDVERYVAGCLRLTQLHYDYVFLLGQLEVYEVAVKRPAANPAYHRHFDLILKGLLNDLGEDINYMILQGQAHQFRMNLVQRTIVQRLDAFEKARAGVRHVN